jgi:uncharacterized membrane protein YdjX (TVP38/TMEM64 family)
MTGSGDEAAAPARSRVMRFLPLAILICGLALFFALGWHRYATFEHLQEQSGHLKSWIARWGLWAAVAFGFGYAVMTACSVPGGLIATIAAGYLFGIAAGTVVVALGATLGAIAVFLAARTALGAALRAKAGGAIAKVQEGFRKDAFSYLLFLRLVPVFPFWLVNLVPAFAGVPLRTYALATFIGILPGTIVFILVGNGLDAVLREGGKPDYKLIFKWEILLPILGLAVLALLPVLHKRLKARRAAGAP